MKHNEANLSQIIAGLEWYTRVASEIGHCTIKQDEIQAYLKAFKELTEENERLERICDSYALQYGTVTDKEAFLKKERTDTVRKMQEVLKSHIKGTNEGMITNLKRLIDYHAEKMIEGDTK